MARLWLSLSVYQLKTSISLSLLVGVTGISAGVMYQHKAIAQVSQRSLSQPASEVAPVNSPKPTQSKKSANQRKQPVAEEFPQNPLEITQPDPLIPYDYKIVP